MPATYLLPVSEYQVGFVALSVKYKPLLPNCQNSTTEDITFAEAFSALANFDPALPPDHNVDEVRSTNENNICKY